MHGTCERNGGSGGREKPGIGSAKGRDIVKMNFTIVDRRGEGATNTKDDW